MWRRVTGAILMGLGGLAALGMTLVAGVVIVNFVEWENAADALGTLARLSALPLLAGIAIFALGRWIYGRPVLRRPANPKQARPA